MKLYQAESIFESISTLGSSQCTKKLSKAKRNFDARKYFLNLYLAGKEYRIICNDNHSNECTE